MGRPETSCLDGALVAAVSSSCTQGQPPGYPLAFSQESLWLIEQLAPGLPTYNLPEAWVLRGALDQEALQKSLDEVVGRHETLRTYIRDNDGKPEQVIADAASLPLKILALPSAQHSEAELQRTLQNEARKSFDLGCAPLARAVLFQRASEEHVLFLNLHHIISDAWSQVVLLRELAQSYARHVTGKGEPLPELPVQYADFALWQRDLVESEAGKQDLAYWRSKLKGSLEPLLLPTDYPRRALRSYNGASQFLNLPGELVQTLQRVSRQEGVTVFMTLLAAFKVLLHRYTQLDDIIVGSPMAGRDRTEVEGLIGMFVNTHALRTDLGGDPPFIELLHRVREVVLDTYAHQEIPAEVVMQGSQVESTTPGRAPFRVVFGWQGSIPERLAFAGLEASRMEVETQTAKFEWTVLVSECGGALQVRSEYSTDLFKPETMSRLMHQFKVLLESIVATPQCRISHLPLMRPEEREQLVRDWNQTQTHYESDLCIHQLFEAQARKTPSAIALEFQGRQMTYGELDARASQLAWRLIDAGAGPRARVALCLERSFELIVGLLGILKTGAAYVPVDRKYPRERIEYMLRDCEVTVVVADRAWASQQQLPAWIRKVIDPESDGESLGQLHAQDFPTTTDASDLAYIMYTSGSTGTPKGVLVPHRAVIRLVRNTNYIEFSEEQVFLQLAPLTFDASTFEIFGALLNGARLVLFPAHIPSLEELGRTIQEKQITTVWLTAGLFHQMIERQVESLQGLKYLLAGGDVLSPAHVAKAVRDLGKCRLINGYGPTENTTFTCCYTVPQVWPEDQAVPIGRPIANTKVFVLDRHQSPVPIGVPGELYAGGDGLAHGYVNQRELTSEKFLTNCGLGDVPLRLYRTGDLVRWLPDGILQFLGRNDTQVKIRGYRIEPGEVENALTLHPEIEAAVVIGRSHNSGERQLVAYIVARAGQTEVPADIREFLRGKLPQYMIPSWFVLLKEMPLTANGKIDRKALPEPVQTMAGADAELMLRPGTPTEEIVRGIWMEVLGLKQIGLRQDFFQLGGHSLLATQVISRLNKVRQIDLPVIAIFEAPTISQLATVVERAQCQPAMFAGSEIGRAIPARAAELLERLGELSEQELDELLEDPELKSVL